MFTPLICLVAVATVVASKLVTSSVLDDLR